MIPHSQSHHPTPLRYPGGKSKLASFVSSLIEHNGLGDCHYCEPFAGGGGVAFALLRSEVVSGIHLNDLDRSVYSFWRSILDHTEDFSRLVHDTPLTMAEWHRQSAILSKGRRAGMLPLGFATFFLNRTNHSGIVNGGPIGGYEQLGKWKMDARFNRKDLVKRIERIAEYKSRITIYNEDAAVFLKETVPAIRKKCFLFADPPYYVKGQRLYRNYYEPSDHAVLSRTMMKLKVPWILSYDDCSDVRALYKESRSISYGLSYTAHERRSGREVMFFSDSLALPSRKTLRSWLTP